MFVQSQFSHLLENQLLPHDNNDCEAIQEYVESFDELVVWIKYGYLDWD
jgi:hypothetical protein